MGTVRCDDHVGEDHPPRCGLCESLSAEYALLKITSPQSGKRDAFIENDSQHASRARVEWLGMDCAWAACGHCNYDGPLHYGILCHGQALIDLEQHTARHRNSQTHTTHTTQRSN